MGIQSSEMSKCSWIDPSCVVYLLQDVSHTTWLCQQQFFYRSVCKWKATTLGCVFVFVLTKRKSAASRLVTQEKAADRAAAVRACVASFWFSLVNTLTLWDDPHPSFFFYSLSIVAFRSLTPEKRDQSFKLSWALGAGLTGSPPLQETW